MLRGLDSNERPPGYEPGELPTAPPRDVISVATSKFSIYARLLSVASAKLVLFTEMAKLFPPFLQKKVLAGRDCEVMIANYAQPPRTL